MLTSEAFVAGLLLPCLWAIICRMAMLEPSKRTLPVFLQLFALGLGICGGLLLPGPYGRMSLAAGLAVFLAIGAHRWRFAAPGSLGRYQVAADSRQHGA